MAKPSTSEAVICVQRSRLSTGRIWLSAELTITKAVPGAVGLEFLNPAEAQERVARWAALDQSMVAGNSQLIIGSQIGELCPPLGMSVAFGCALHFYGGGFAVLDLEVARRAIQQGREAWGEAVRRESKGARNNAE